ncbi:TetR/AcrR family transcriptional regulator [Staphylococcus equorum]|uniref:TetR/AcrR family transcriptional regulator n=1 Tax=Staphylococcus equorum TaxID=246432 RepID=UPI003D8022FE
MRKDAEENRRRIEAKAKELFEEYGVENTSMNRISKDLGIGMGTLYRHFEDKSVLCYKLIENDFDTLFEQMEIEEQNKQKMKYEKFERYLDYFLDFKSNHSESLKCVEKKEYQGDFRNTSTYKKLFDKFFNAFEKEDNEAWITFKTDMLLNALTTKSYEYQVNKRQLSNEQLKQLLMKLFNMNGEELI